MAIVPRPRPLSIRLPQKLRYAVRLTYPDRIGNELSFDCFCLDIYLLLITCQLLLLTIINLLPCKLLTLF